MNAKYRMVAANCNRYYPLIDTHDEIVGNLHMTVKHYYDAEHYRHIYIHIVNGINISYITKHVSGHKRVDIMNEPI